MLRKSPKEIEQNFVLPNTDKQALAPDRQLQMLRKSRNKIQQHFVFPNIETQPHTPHQKLQMLTQPQARSSSIVLCQTQTNNFSHQTSSYNCSESHAKNLSSILSKHKEQSLTPHQQLQIIRSSILSFQAYRNSLSHHTNSSRRAENH